jgi:hypothetical protein
MLDDKTFRTIRLAHQKDCYLKAIIKLLDMKTDIFIYQTKAKGLAKSRLSDIKEAYKRKIFSLTEKYLAL